MEVHQGEVVVEVDLPEPEEVDLPEPEEEDHLSLMEVMEEKEVAVWKVVAEGDLVVVAAVEVEAIKGQKVEVYYYFNLIKI